jgi:hypothetical protein
MNLCYDTLLQNGQHVYACLSYPELGPPEYLKYICNFFAISVNILYLLLKFGKVATGCGTHI